MKFYIFRYLFFLDTNFYLILSAPYLILQSFCDFSMYIETLVMIINQIELSMPQRKPWSQRQDQILRLLKDQRGVKKWSEIARTMEFEFGVQHRTGKQCRERYHNHLDAAIITTEWSRAEEATLCLAHEEVGNKWSLIAQRLPGRSDNCVKNHFYSKLRKAARRLNRAIHHRYRKDYRDFKLPLLNRVVQTTEQRFKDTSKFEPEAIAQSLDLTQRLFSLEQVHPSEAERQQRELIEQLTKFESVLRRASRSLKEHKASIQTNCGRESGEQPYLQIFKRVCQQFMHDQQ